MKKLLFVLLLCGCATVKPPQEVVLELPHPAPQQTKPLEPLAPPKEFITDENIKEAHDRMLRLVSQFDVYSVKMGWDIRDNLSNIINHMYQVVDSIKPGIDANALLDHHRLIDDYMKLVSEISEFNIETLRKIEEINDRAERLFKNENQGKNHP